MATVNLAHQTAIAKLYVALFNRAPDASGFEYWGQAMANGVSIPVITSSLLTSPESLAIYTKAQTAADFVTTFYQTVFGRAPDANGLGFWTSELNAAGGIASNEAKALLVMKIVDVVSTPLPIKPADLSDAQYAETVNDREIFRKKVLAGIDFATSAHSDDMGLAKQALASLNAPTVPVIVDPVATAPEASRPVPDPNQTFTLSTGGETLAGGPGNDTFNAPDFAGRNSLNTHDDLDGGDGTDTLNVRLADAYREIPSLKNIELVNVSSLTAGALLDLRNATDITHVNITNSDASSDVLVYNVGTANLSVSSQTANVAFTGITATTLSLSLSQVGTASSLSTVDLARWGAGIGDDGNGAGALATAHSIDVRNAYVAIVETRAGAAVIDVNVAATGTNALTLSLADAGTVKHIAVTGSGSVDFTGRALSALETFTTGTGAITLETAGALSATARITLGAGDDVIILGQGSVEGAVVDGGAGNDRIITGAVTHAQSAPAVLGSVDTLTGGAGADTFVFTTADVGSTAGAVTAVITDFLTGVDKIVVSHAGAGQFVQAAGQAGSLADLLTAAETALDGTTRYYIGEFDGSAYLVTDIDGNGYTNVIKLAGLDLNGIVAGDLLAV